MAIWKVIRTVDTGGWTCGHVHLLWWEQVYLSAYLGCASVEPKKRERP